VAGYFIRGVSCQYKVDASSTARVFNPLFALRVLSVVPGAGRFYVVQLQDHEYHTALGHKSYRCCQPQPASEFERVQRGVFVRVEVETGRPGEYWI